MAVSRARHLVSLLSLATLSLTFSGASAFNVRVLIAAAPQLTVRVPTSKAAASALAPAGLDSPNPGSAWKVGVVGKNLSLNGQDAGNNVLYLPPTPGSTVEIAGKPYRGGVLLRAQLGGVQAINVVEVDDYVRGVVASEMPASWPAPALAAQAIIARTYVAARVNPAQPYDTCAGESCQVYGGINAEKPQTDAAVRSTAGQVVAYRGKAASTYFSSDSGGYTASAQEVWGMNGLPYLPAQADPFSAGGPRAQWSFSVPLARVQAIAASYGARVGALSSVAVTRLTPSGRPQEITFKGAGGSFVLSGAEAGGFIRTLGAGSSRASLSGLNPLVVSGYGQGHGVGLSQYGALGMARKGYDHLHILGFYYPGTVLSDLAATPRPQSTWLAGLPLPGLSLPSLGQPSPSYPLASKPLASELLASTEPALSSTLAGVPLPAAALLAGTPLPAPERINE